MWTEQAKIQKEIYKPWSTKEQELHPITSTNEEWRKFQTEHIIKEFDQLAHMPLDLKEKMNGWTEYFGDKERNCYYGREKLSPIVMHTILYGFRYPAEDKVIELIREAYSVMDYIGIGVCWNYVESEQFEDDGNGGIKYDENGKEVHKDIYRAANRSETSFRVSAMLKKVCGNMRKFVSDIKKGFDAHDVRELVIEDLNAWCTAQARGHWQFFERDDAPKEYPDLCKKKKAKKNSNKTDSLELNETELEVVKMFKERNNNNEQS